MNAPAAMPSDDPHPDLADDLLHRVQPVADAVDDRHAVGRHYRHAAADVTHPFLQPALQVQPPDHPARHDGDAQAEGRDRISAIFQPTKPNSRPSATSLTIGAEIRNEKVTPSGTPAETKPMKSGTAEQEQNGVTIAEHRRRDIADAFAPAGQQCPGVLWREEAAHNAHGKDDQCEQKQHLGRVIGEEGERLARLAEPVDRQQSD